MQTLAERTGVHVITFVTRGHVDDLVVPGWHATTGCANFFTDSLKLSLWDVVRMFEQWACARSLSKFQFPSTVEVAYREKQTRFSVKLCSLLGQQS